MLVMGMYDDFYCDKKFLPDGIPSGGWQTKSYICNLETIELSHDGLLYVSDVDTLEKNRMYYTGEIRFYQTINNERHEFVAFFTDGKLLGKAMKV